MMTPQTESTRKGKIRIALLAAITTCLLCDRALAENFSIPDGDVEALKTAIASANTNSQDDTVDLASNGTYTLTSIHNFTKGPNGLPVVSADNGHKLVINGHGAILERSISFTPFFRILQIGPAANVTINDLTIANGMATEFPGFGGGIFNDHGTLSATNCTFSNNTAGSGGGIYNNGNSSGNATLSVTDSTFRENSTVALPTAGGIFNDGSFGGHATLSLFNSTFSFNSGGAIWNNGDLGSATLNVTNSTFSGGTSILNGGPFGGSSPVHIGNTILHNLSPQPSITNSLGTITSLGYNLSNDDGGGFLTGAGDQINTDPMLDPAGLQDNGGPTGTIALLPGSPAIDKGKDIGGTGHDQRGSARPFDFAAIPNATDGDGSDIGAFELKDTDVKDADGDGVPDSEDACPNSDLRPTVFVDTCNTMVLNHLFPNGCTMADLIADVAAQAKNHGAFVSGVARLTNDWRRQGIISGAEKGAIQSCAGKSKLP